MEAEFSQISTAYNVLKDKDKRETYDKTLEQQRAAAVKSETSAKPPASVASSGGMPMAPGGITSGSQEKNKAGVAKRAFLKGLQLMQAGDFSKASEFFEVAIKNNEAEA